jgi:hypothetical protein
MKVQITIDVDNDAFQNSDELRRLVQVAGEKAINMPLVPGCWVKLQDINGNTVGKVKVLR